MKEQKIQRPPLLIFLFLSWFYSGTSPKAPGTVGSLATVPLIYLLYFLGINSLALWILILILFFTAVVLTEKVQKKFKLHDPQWIVIDEVIGMLITWSFVHSVDIFSLILVFVSFRFFDIVKVWPASYFDRLHHGMGTIADDFISGLYAGIFCLLYKTFF